VYRSWVVVVALGGAGGALQKLNLCLPVLLVTAAMPSIMHDFLFLKAVILVDGDALGTVAERMEEISAVRSKVKVGGRVPFRCIQCCSSVAFSVAVPLHSVLQFHCVAMPAGSLHHPAHKHALHPSSSPPLPLTPPPPSAHTHAR
jgi:hypothetical protein